MTTILLGLALLALLYLFVPRDNDAAGVIVGPVEDPAEKE